MTSYIESLEADMIQKIQVIETTWKRIAALLSEISETSNKIPVSSPESLTGYTHNLTREGMRDGKEAGRGRAARLFDGMDGKGFDDGNKSGTCAKFLRIKGGLDE